MITTISRHQSPWYKGNISLMMLFVLAIGSLIGLMSTWFVQDMISSSSQIRNFYQSYYIAKGGLELWTLAVNRYEYGFEDQLSGTTLIMNNLNCKKDCNLNLTVKSRITTDDSNGITINTNLEPIANHSCTFSTPDKFTLAPGESSIIPLFADERKLSVQGPNTIQNILSQTPQYNLTLANSEWAAQSHPIGVGVVLWTTHQNEYNIQDITAQQQLYITGTISDTLNIQSFLYNTKALDPSSQEQIMSIADKFSWNPIAWDPNNDRFNYLYITNVSPTNSLSYCLTIKPSAYGYVSDKSIVSAISTYWTTSLWLQAQVRKPLLEYVIRPYTTWTVL